MMLELVMLLLILAALMAYWPHCGFVARWKARRRGRARVAREDALKHIYKRLANQSTPSLQGIAGALGIAPGRVADLVADLERRQLITLSSGTISLTAEGRAAALRVIRAHRLWESYLAEQTGLSESEWHGRAESQEHRLTGDQVNALSAQLGYPTRDPHGDVIPLEGEALPADPGQSLNALPVGQPARIIHIEDEPERIYAQIIAQGLRPGLTVRVEARDADHLQLWGEGRRARLSRIQAHNIFVVPLKPAEVEPDPHFLCDLAVGDKATVLGVSEACRGAERRRLLDLGFVPGTEVEATLASPMGDPTAYQLRGTTVALRREQARFIRIEPSVISPTS